MPSESDLNALHNAKISDSTHRRGSVPFAFPEAKSSISGVSVSYVPSSDKTWFVLRILYGHTRQVADMLVDDQVYCYVAMIWKDVRKNGKRRRVLVPFLNLVFAYATPGQAEHYVKDCPESRFITYYYNHFATDAFGKNPPLTIDQGDMEPLVRATALQDPHVMEVNIAKCHFTSGDTVRVTYGPFEGIEGRVARINRQSRVVVYIKGLQAGICTAYIPSHCLEKVNGDGK